jgi:hypothetical protein
LGAYLGCKIESQVAVALEPVLNEERDLVGEAQLDLVGHATCLAEVDEVLEREGKGHGLGQIDLDVVLRLLDIRVASQLDGAGANVARTLEAHAVLCALN